MTDDEIYKAYGVRPACKGLSRKEVTTLLSHMLVDMRLTRRNAYSYWAHEVEVWDESRQKLVRVDFMAFEPQGWHAATHGGNVERGIFSCYEVKSCMEDVKSGYGLNLFGDQNFIVMPVETYVKVRDAWWGTAAKNYTDKDDKLRELIPYFSIQLFLLYGRSRGYGKFVEVGGVKGVNQLARRKPASELLFCMMRALLANSDHSDVDHKIERYGGEA